MLVAASYAGSLADTSWIGCSSVRRASRTVGLVMGGGIYAPVTAESWCRCGNDDGCGCV